MRRAVALGTLIVISLFSSLCCAEAPKAEAAEPPYQVVLGARGFGGVSIKEGEGSGIGGGGLLVGLPIFHDRWETELALGVSASDNETLGLTELTFKRIFERHGNFAPHFTLGPALSLDLGEDSEVSFGVVLGGGITYWLSRSFGVVGDASYRLLFGAETRDILTGALGVAFRL